MPSRPFKTLWVLVLALAIGAMALPQSVALGATKCSCLNYFGYNKGLPATGNAYFPAYQYSDWLSTHGYKVTYYTPSKDFIGPGQFIGVGLIFNPGVLGADKTYGHIAVVQDVKYSTATKKWIITFKDANSGYPFAPGQTKMFTESGCTNVGLRQVTTGSLSGLRFFRWTKK